MKKISILTILSLSLYLDVTYSTFVHPAKYMLSWCLSQFVIMLRPDSSEDIQDSFWKNNEIGPDYKED